MEPFVIFLSVVISLITLVILVVGVQVVLLLRKLNKATDQFLGLTNALHDLAVLVKNPLSDPQAYAKGLDVGLKFASHFRNWLEKGKTKQS